MPVVYKRETTNTLGALELASNKNGKKATRKTVVKISYLVHNSCPSNEWKVSESWEKWLTLCGIRFLAFNKSGAEPSVG